MLMRLSSFSEPNKEMEGEITVRNTLETLKVAVHLFDMCCDLRHLQRKRRPPSGHSANTKSLSPWSLVFSTG